MAVRARKWWPIETAPKDMRITLLIPYSPHLYSEEDCTDKGEWSEEHQCFRFDGDDGPNDIQPTHWRL